MTNANLYSMVEILCVIIPTFYLQDKRAAGVNRDEQPLVAGDLFLLRVVGFFAF